MKLENRVALVTGAAKGIGRAIAMALAGEGAYTLINYAGSEKKAKQTKADIEAAGGRAEICRCDVSDFSAVKEMIDGIIGEHGKLDILVNNAGITRDNLLMKMSEEEFDAVIDANLKGSFHCMQAASRHMIKARYGRIINISSVSGLAGNMGQVNYSASKAGLIGMSKSAAREMASRGITVNAVAPGFIVTDMTNALSDKIKESMTEMIPMRRFGAPEDIAEAVLFLAGEGAGYITGQTLSINGGMYM